MSDEELDQIISDAGVIRLMMSGGADVTEEVKSLLSRIPTLVEEVRLLRSERQR